MVAMGTDGGNADDGADDKSGESRTEKQATAWGAIGVLDEIAGLLVAAGFEGPTALQKVLLPAIASERDVLCEAPAGSGRTIAIAASVAELVADCEPGADPVALIVSSNDERCQNIADAIATTGSFLRRASSDGVRLGIVTELGSMDAQGELLSRDLDVVVGTPARLAALIEAEALSTVSVELLLVDEADAIALSYQSEQMKTLLGLLAPDRQRVVLAGALLSPLLDLTGETLRDPQRPAPEPVPTVSPAPEQHAYAVSAANPETVARLVGLLGSPTTVVITPSAEAAVFRSYFATRSLPIAVLTGVAELSGPVEPKPDLLVLCEIPTDSESYARVLSAASSAGIGALALLTTPAHRQLLRSLGKVGGLQLNAAPLPGEAGLDALRTDRTEQLVEEQLSRVSSQPTPRFLSAVHRLAASYDVADIAAAAMDLAHRSLQQNISPGGDVPLLLRSPSGRAESKDRRTPAPAEMSDPNRRKGSERRQREVEDGMIRLFVAAGYNYGVRPGDIVGAFAGESGLSGKEIGNIDIRETFTLVEVPEGSADDVINAMATGTIKGRQIEVRRERY